MQHRNHQTRANGGAGRQCGTHARGQASSSRRGAILIIAMICLLLVTLLLGSLLKLAVEQRKQLRFEEQHVQAACLAESGLERAASRLRTDRRYEGETWQIAADELTGRFPGEVRIKVRNSVAAPDRRIVAVEAVYPSNAIHFSKRTRQILVDVQAP